MTVHTYLVKSNYINVYVDEPIYYFFEQSLSTLVLQKALEPHIGSNSALDEKLDVLVNSVQ